MQLFALGINHQTAPLELREQVVFSAENLAQALRDLVDRNPVKEAAIISTCNRTEIYVRCTKFHNAVSDVLDFMAEQASLEPDDFTEHLYTYYDDGAVAHLFRVAAGLDSMIVGEGEILGQVREAWRLAETEGELEKLADLPAIVEERRAAILDQLAVAEKARGEAADRLGLRFEHRHTGLTPFHDAVRVNLRKAVA